jgi:predicted DsbA family dithiol-disulfide isomerase
MALENPNITTDAIAINEYPQLAQRYHVMGVPKTMIDGRDGIEGALPEHAFISALVLQSTESHESS